MLNSKSFLAVDFGAGALKLAEFEQNEAGGLRLRQYGTKPLGLEGAQEPTRETTVLRALQDLLAEKTYQSRNINVCAPGFHVFSKFVKLPPVDTSKVQQIIQYEAQQNVPFPLEEVVWDYQILGTSASGELEVLLVAIKQDIVEGLFRVVEGAGLRLDLVDVSAASLCNAFRFNYGDLEGCTMLLDIGAKTSNLLFFEKGKVYSRSINIGANSITQDFANEAKMSFAEAEQFKIAEGFVSLGGAYEEPENPQQAQISKIARQVMTRLHIQVNQTINFYRGQQGGSAPQRVFLCGGASIMPYMAQFFTEKLNLPVDYFNPFRNIEIDPDLDLEDLSVVAHAFGETVGLGLRNLAHCPVELNLMPKSSIQRQEFGAKKPYLVAAVFSLVLAIFVIGWVFGRMASMREAALQQINAQAMPLKEKEDQLRRAQSSVDAVKTELDQLAELVDNRFFWPEILAELHRILREVEVSTKEKIQADVGLWIEAFMPVLPAASGFEQTADFGGYPGMGLDDPRYMESPEPMDYGDPSYGYDPGMGYEEEVMYDPLTGEPIMAGDLGAPDELTIIEIVCRSVNISSAANNELAYTLKSALEASPLFDEEGVKLKDIRAEHDHMSGLTGTLSAPLTFTLDLSLKLKRPLKF